VLLLAVFLQVVDASSVVASATSAHPRRGATGDAASPITSERDHLTSVAVDAYGEAHHQLPPQLRNASIEDPAQVRRDTSTFGTGGLAPAVFRPHAWLLRPPERFKRQKKPALSSMSKLAASLTVEQEPEQEQKPPGDANNEEKSRTNNVEKPHGKDFEGPYIAPTADATSLPSPGTTEKPSGDSHSDDEKQSSTGDDVGGRPAKDVSNTTAAAVTASTTVNASDSASQEELRAMVKAGMERNGKEWPPWLMFLITMVESLVLAFLFFKCTSCCFPAAAAAGSVSDDLDALRLEIEESKRRTEELEDSLRAEMLQHAHLAEASNVASRQLPGDAPGEVPELLSHLGVASGDLPPSAGQATGQVLEEAVRGTAREQAQQLAHQATAAQQVLEEGLLAFRGKVEQLARNESDTIYKVVQDVMATENIPGSTLPNWLPNMEESVQLPPPYLVLCGLLAPALMKATSNHARLNLLWDGVIVAACVVLLILDGRSKCGDTWVWVWHIGISTLAAADCLCNFYLLRQCRAAMDEMKEAEDLRKANAPNTGSEMWDNILFTLQDGGQYFFTTLFKHEEISSSLPYHLVKYIQLLCVIWGFLGIKLTISNVLQDAVSCDANHILSFMHFYAFIYLVFWLLNVLNLLVWVLMRVASSSMVTRALLNLAKKLDTIVEKDLPFHLPIFMTLVRGLVLPNASDILQVKVRAMASDIEHLEKEHQRLLSQASAKQANIDSLKHELHEIEEEKASATELEADMVERYQQTTNEALEALKPFVAFAAGRYDSGMASSTAEFAALAATAQQVAAGAAEEFATIAEDATAASAATAAVSNLRSAAAAAAGDVSASALEAAAAAAGGWNPAAATAASLSSSAAELAEGGWNPAAMTASFPQFAGGDVGSSAADWATTASSAAGRIGAQVAAATQEASSAVAQGRGLAAASGIGIATDWAPATVQSGTESAEGVPDAVGDVGAAPDGPSPAHDTG